MSPTRNTPTHVGKTFVCRKSASTLRKHPHARGEDGGVNYFFSFFLETPPRTWGRLFPEVLENPLGRNTPTHVGKTDAENHRECRGKKHPHARGEDSRGMWSSLPLPETPPRTWGRPPPSSTSTSSHRNTPTHVGKTSLSAAFMAARMKHPHARGEDLCAGSFFVYWMETPPRTWGRHRMKISFFLSSRNTPTHVGKTNF